MAPDYMCWRGYRELASSGTITVREFNHSTKAAPSKYMPWEAPTKSCKKVDGGGFPYDLPCSGMTQPTVDAWWLGSGISYSTRWNSPNGHLPLGTLLPFGGNKAPGSRARTPARESLSREYPPPCIATLPIATPSVYYTTLGCVTPLVPLETGVGG